MSRFKLCFLLVFVWNTEGYFLLLQDTINVFTRFIIYNLLVFPKTSVQLLIIHSTDVFCIIYMHRNFLCQLCKKVLNVSMFDNIMIMLFLFYLGHPDLPKRMAPWPYIFCLKNLLFWVWYKPYNGELSVARESFIQNMQVIQIPSVLLLCVVRDFL